jgi:hypothetical protein
VELFKAKTQVFILRFWLEPREIEGTQQFWRGMIEIVPTGDRHYFTRIDEIPRLIRPYLKYHGIGGDQRKSIWQWLRQIAILKNKKSW